ncbi:hypothetical protein JRC04_16910 [Mycolicibacterium sp. S2-37]|uniref:hypothetical protein n=1 Tax=Mycolicibacterium sp. S2-37 TaxID=2810297 RepID=UPI001A94C87C|nr:hypothetical protein [Mycolicibacterium sp. S2-37]MBO0679147.1 hypothetical protein [Mycolicibacterium sp. S2-37]
MSKNHSPLALRRQSIRTLSPAELRAAQGGRGGNGTGTGTGNGTGTGTGNGTGTGTRTKA